MAEASKRWLTFRRVLVGAVVLILLAALGLFLYVNHLLHSPTVWQTSGPVTLQEASGRCPIPLPATAKNIQYAAYSHWAAYEAFVRFEAPATDCLAHVDAIIKMSPPYDHPIKLMPIDPSCLVLKMSDLPSAMKTSWFDLQRIKRGQWGGGGGSYWPQVWVDEDNGVFYYHITD